MKKRFIFKKGFTLVEMLICIIIFGAMVTVVLKSQSTYTEQAAVTNVGDQISLSLSKAQAYGIGVKEVTPGSNNFSASYGMSFNILPGGSNKDYISFADKDKSHTYNGDLTCPTGGSNECVEKAPITQGNYIDTICIIRSSGGDLCNAQRVDITYTRPTPGAQLTFYNSAGNIYSPSNIVAAKVVIKSPNNINTSVIAYNNGQIAIDNSYSYQYPTPYATPYASPYSSPYGTPYGTPYSSPYAYQSPYATPVVTPPTITYDGPGANDGTYVVGSGALYLTVPGVYAISVDKDTSVILKGVSAGGGGGSSYYSGGVAHGGGGGGGGASSMSGVSVALTASNTYTVKIPRGGAGAKCSVNFGTGDAGESNLYFRKVSGLVDLFVMTPGSGGSYGFNGGGGGPGGIAKLGAGIAGGKGGTGGGSGAVGGNAVASTGTAGGGGGGGWSAKAGGAGGNSANQTGGAGGAGGLSGTSMSGFGGYGGNSSFGGGGGGGGGGGVLVNGVYYGGGGGGGGDEAVACGASAKSAGGDGQQGVLVIQ